jgi:hypothetical protein
MSNDPEGKSKHARSYDPFNRPTFGGGSRPTFDRSDSEQGKMMDWSWRHAPASVAGKGSALYGKSIWISGSDLFVKHVRSKLDEIAKTPTGAKLLGARGSAAGQSWQSKFQVVISKGKTCRSEPVNSTDGWKKDSYIMYDHLGLPVTYGNKGTGKGCGSKIEYNPAQSLPNEPWFRNMPTALLLAHELIHSYLYASGEADPEVKDEIRNHERQVVGLAPFEGGDITENKIRAEWHPVQPKRTKYTRWKKR